MRIKQKKSKRNYVFNKYNGRCAYCGKKLSINYIYEINNYCSIDHIIPKSVGGNNDILNLNPCCKICNSIKGNRTIEELRKYLYCRFKESIFSGFFNIKKRYGKFLFYFEKIEVK